MAKWFTFHLKPPVAHDLYDAILDIPGATFKGPTIHVSENGAWAVEEALQKHGAQYNARAFDKTPVLAVPVQEDLLSLLPMGLRQKTAEMALPYQREGICWSARQAGSFYWWSPGAGKTLGAISWLLHSPPPYVVVTKAAARHQFAGEVRNFTHLRPVVIEGQDAFDYTALAARTPKDAWVSETTAHTRGRKRRRGWEYEPENQAPGSVGIFILGWEILPFHAAALAKMKPTAVVFDEIHRAKSTKRFKASVQSDGTLAFEKRNNVAAAALDLSRAVPRRLGTTATPVKDRVRDLWAQLDLMDPGAWGPFWRIVRNPDGSEGRPLGFAFRYCDGHPGQYGGIDASGESHADELAGRLQFVAHVVPRSITHRDLPPKRRVVTWIPPSEQASVPREFKTILKQAARQGGTAFLEARLMEAAARKRDFVLDTIVSALEGGQKVVVLTGRHKDCDMLGAAVEKKLGSEKIDAELWVAHGGNSTPSARTEVMRSYMGSPGPALIIGTMDAWGESVNLQDTDLAAFVMLPYIPSMLEQAEGRFTRHGQKRPVTIQYFVAEGTIDEHVASILLDKLPAVERMGVNDEAHELAKGLMGAGNEEELIESLLGKLSQIDAGTVEDGLGD